MEYNVQDVCPLLMSLDKDHLIYDGFITVHDQSFQVHIELASRDNLKGMKLDCEWRLQNMLSGYADILQQRIQQCQDLSTFLVEMKSIVERVLKSEEKHMPWQPPEFYTQLLQQIEHIGWNRLAFVDPGFKKIHLTTTDKGKRKHTLKLCLDSKHPEHRPEANADLPVPFSFTWTPENMLEDLLLQFDKAIEGHQDLWDLLEDLDKKTWVLEPEKPVAYSATFRRIAIGSHASLQVELNPLHPRLLPVIRFLGADRIINPLKENFNQNLHTWKPDSSLLDNLQTVLCIEFPSPSTSTKEEFSVECGICYAYRLDGQLPDQVCDDQRCGQSFHHMCLYEWLRSLSTSRQSFNLVFGECPYCGKSLTVKMPTQ